jgi:hypothetical protein
MGAVIYQEVKQRKWFFLISFILFVALYFAYGRRPENMESLFMIFPMSVPTATLCLAGQVIPNVNAKITADIRFIFFTQIYIPDPDLSADNKKDS